MADAVRKPSRRFRARGAEAPAADGASRPSAGCDGWTLVEGDDVLTPQVRECHASWLQVQTLQSTLDFADPAFPPCPRSVDGKDAPADSRSNLFISTLSESAKATRPAEAPPFCLCGRPAAPAVLRGDGPAKGRPFWRCAGRACRFFELADGGPSLAAAELTWERCTPPTWNVVSDAGFRPEDVRQGQVGDCWFMSALAVVAERHDLLEKLLPNLNEGAHLGCHEVRLFLDGRWVACLLDSHFPMAPPDKQKRRDETGLAFGRAADHQLWVPLIEKAYARAHGAYKAISGGQVSEAMLDLTGCPTETVNFRLPGFDKEMFWCRLLSFLEARFPVGCGTGAETIEELGLVGQHAYSVLDASERLAEDSCGQCRPTRMVKVRNPWGVWTQKEQDRVLQALGAAITDDGAFWMPYDDFVRGFAVADVCKARLGWHARSFEVAFGGAAAGGTGARKVLRLRTFGAATECHIVAVQPTERGAKHRRPPGYLLNDVNFAVLDAATGSLAAMTLGGALRDVASGDSLLLDAEREYLVVPFSFKARPGSCVLRVCAARPLAARAVDAAPSQVDWLWRAVHSYAAGPARALGSWVQRMVHQLRCSLTGQPAGALIVLEGTSLALGAVANDTSSDALSICAVLEANQMIACTAGGLSEGQRSGTKPKERPRQGGGSKGRGKGKGKGAEEDWREFACEAVVPPGSQQLLFAMVPVSRMRADYDLSLVEVRVACQPHDEVPQAPPSGAFAPVLRRSLAGSFGADGQAVDADLLAALAASLAPEPHATSGADSDGDDDAVLEAALMASLLPAGPGPPVAPAADEGEEEDDAVLEAALMASLAAAASAPAAPAAPAAGEEEDDAAMAVALAMSLAEAEPRPCQGVTEQPAGRWRRRHRAS